VYFVVEHIEYFVVDYNIVVEDFVDNEVVDIVEDYNFVVEYIDFAVDYNVVECTEDFVVEYNVVECTEDFDYNTEDFVVEYMYF